MKYDERGAAGGAREREQHERPAPSEAIAADGHEQRCHRAAGEPGGHHHADGGGVEALRREVQPEEHAEHPDAERAQKRGGEQKLAVAHPLRGN